MKESDKDLYTPAGLWVTSYRILRFFDDGKLFSYLCAAQVRPPAEPSLCRATAHVHPLPPLAETRVSATVPRARRDARLCKRADPDRDP